jgi:hypothetical protein
LSQPTALIAEASDAIMTKGRLLTLWIAFSVFAYVSASQDWFTLSMSPEGKTVKLASYDGLTSYSSLSATLMLNFAGILAVAFVGTIGRKSLRACSRS